MKKTPSRSAAEWSKLVTAWQRSRKTASEFAAAHGLSRKSLVWWRWYLARKQKQPAAPNVEARRTLARQAHTSHAQLQPEPRLVAVEVVPELFEEHPDGAATWELVDGRGLALRVHAPLSSCQLDRVLAAMQAPEQAT